MNSYSKSSGDGLDTSYQVSSNHCTIGAGVKPWVAFPFKNHDTLADCLQHRTSHDGTISATHLKPDHYLARRRWVRHTPDRHTADITHVLRGIVRIKMCCVRGHRSAV